MILQDELAAVLEIRCDIAQLAGNDAVRKYLARLADEKSFLDSLRARVKRGEPVEPGTLRLDKKLVYAVKWERLWQTLRELPAIARALAADPKAGKVLREAIARNPRSEYVETRVSIDVLPEEPQCGA